MKTVTGRPDQAVMAIEVPRVCNFRQLLLVLEVQSASKLANALRPQMQHDMSIKRDKLSTSCAVLNATCTMASPLFQMKVEGAFAVSQRGRRGRWQICKQSPAPRTAFQLCTPHHFHHVWECSYSKGTTRTGNGRQDARVKAGAHRASSGRLKTITQLALRKHKFPKLRRDCP